MVRECPPSGWPTGFHESASKSRTTACSGVADLHEDATRRPVDEVATERSS
jgi:hypothetical protein